MRSSKNFDRLKGLLGGRGFSLGAGPEHDWCLRISDPTGKFYFEKRLSDKDFALSDDEFRERILASMLAQLEVRANA